VGRAGRPSAPCKKTLFGFLTKLPSSKGPPLFCDIWAYILCPEFPACASFAGTFPDLLRAQPNTPNSRHARPAIQNATANSRVSKNAMPSLSTPQIARGTACCPRRLATSALARPLASPLRARHWVQTRPRTSRICGAAAFESSGAGGEAPERNQSAAQTPHASFHYTDQTRRRAFEG
jgi:hypothetical protein